MHSYKSLPCALLLGSTFTLASTVANAVQTQFSILHTFTGGADGAYPVGASLAREKDGTLYGTTPNGGAADAGVVFKIAPGGAETVLYAFPGGGNGANPNGGVIHDKATGDIYGSTSAGGTSANCDGGCGVLYKLSPDGTLTVLHNFDGGDGAMPIGELVRDKKGNFFGAAYGGGNTGNGVVFRLSAKGGYKVLHNFSGTDGTGPSATLSRDAAGNLYGVTQFGGSGGYGVVFRVAPDGTYTMLHDFTGGSDGANPQGGMDLDKDGNLYGTATYGANGKGTVFRLTAKGKFKTLYAFTGADDGEYPQGDLLRTPKSALYGTTTNGGALHNGTAYALSPKGAISVLHSFGGGESDGAYPHAGFVRGGHGALYGLAHSGGGGAGVVFSLTH